jgi:hypothetical protein
VFRIYACSSVTVTFSFGSMTPVKSVDPQFSYEAAQPYARASLRRRFDRERIIGLAGTEAAAYHKCP